MRYINVPSYNALTSKDKHIKVTRELCEVVNDVEVAMDGVSAGIAAETERAEGVEAALASDIEDLQAMEQIVIDGGEAQIAQGGDFTDADATKRAKVPTVGAILDGLNDGVYDVSARNGGATFESLSALLSSNNLSTLIPTSWRKGGMSIRFVQSSDNKYVQYRLRSNTFNTTPANWQGVDDEPNVGSNNLVISGGVYPLNRKVILLEYWGHLSTEISNLSPGTYYYNTYNNTISLKTGAVGETASTYFPIEKNQLYIYNNRFYTSLDGSSVVDILNGIADNAPIYASNNFVKSGGIYPLNRKVILLEYWGGLSTDIANLSPGTYFYNTYNDKICIKVGAIGTTTINQFSIEKNQLYIYDKKLFTSFDGSTVEPVLQPYDIELDKCILLEYWGSQTAPIQALETGSYFYNTYSHNICLKTGVVGEITYIEFPITKNSLFVFNYHFYMSLDGSTLSDITSTQFSNDIRDIKDKVDKIEFNGVYEDNLNPYSILSSAAVTATPAIVPAGSDNYKVYVFNVEGFSILNIGARSNWSNPYYAWASGSDFDNDIISISELHEGNIGTNKIFENVTVPLGAKFLLVNTNVLSDDSPHFAASLRSVISNPLANPLRGKKWACVGDSLTAVNERTTIHYFDYIAKETGVIPLNYGYSGSGYARLQNESKAFYQRISSIDPTSDIITIFGSFNDLGAGLDIGSVDDTGTTTLAGCINTTIDNLYQVIPLTRLGIVAPTPWHTTQPTTSGNAYNYVEMLKSICERRSIPFLDLWRHSNLRPWDAAFREIAYSKDPEGNGTHPDENGHALIAPMFRQFILSLI